MGLLLSILVISATQDSRIVELRGIADQIECATTEFLSGGLEERSFEDERNYLVEERGSRWGGLGLRLGFVGYCAGTILSIFRNGYPPVSLTVNLTDPVVVGTYSLGALGFLWWFYQHVIVLLKRETLESDLSEYTQKLKSLDAKFKIQIQELEAILKIGDSYVIRYRLNEWFKKILELSLEYNFQSREDLNSYRSQYSETPYADIHAAKANQRFAKHLKHTSDQLVRTLRALADRLQHEGAGVLLHGTCYRDLERIRFGPLTTYVDTYSPEARDHKNQ